MKSMTKSELIEILSARHSQLAPKDAELAVKTMLAHIGKETIEKVIDTGSKAVDKENMDSAEIKALLTPDLKSYLDE